MATRHAAATRQKCVDKRPMWTTKPDSVPRGDGWQWESQVRFEVPHAQPSLLMGAGVYVGRGEGVYKSSTHGMNIGYTTYISTL